MITGPLDYVLVMNNCHLTGEALCLLSKTILKKSKHLHILHLSDIHSVLNRLIGNRVLVITELFSDKEVFTQGIEVILKLAGMRAYGINVMVCTNITDPILLRFIFDRHPSALTLLRDPVKDLKVAISSCGITPHQTVLTPNIRELLNSTYNLKFSPRETEWLLTQADGFDLRTSALRMNINYKTAATMRSKIMHRLGENSVAFSKRIASIRCQTGASVNGW